jgi:uncharacterized membrane protein
MAGAAGIGFRVCCGAVVLLAGMTPLLAGHLDLGPAARWIAGGAATLQAGALVPMIGAAWPRFVRAGAAAGAALMVGMLVLRPGVSAEAVGRAVTVCFDASVYGALLVWFARSLRRGREPVVTGFARRVRATMPMEVVRYTRGVTLAWCVFFAAHLAVSAALLALAPAALWLGFAGVLNLPLLAAMMLGEFACRRMLFGRETRTSLRATLAGLRDRRLLRSDAA